MGLWQRSQNFPDFGWHHLCNLPEAVEKNAFRRDLYYRLNVISLEIPPLRDRREDIPELVNIFIQALCTRLKRIPPVVAPEAMTCLQSWDWPGNVRELENVIERVVNLSEGFEITRSDLPESLQENLPSDVSEDMPSSLQNLERMHILQVVSDQHGNLRQSAQLLGISRTALYNKLNGWEIDYRAFRKNMP